MHYISNANEVTKYLTGPGGRPARVRDEARTIRFKLTFCRRARVSGSTQADEHSRALGEEGKSLARSAPYNHVGRLRVRHRYTFFGDLTSPSDQQVEPRERPSYFEHLGNHQGQEKKALAAQSFRKSTNN